MNRFNLTFSGEIQQGEQPDAVKLRFAKKFAIDDPDRLERFFSGNEIILRRNLDRKEAAACFQEMRQIGVVAELVKVADADAETAANSAADVPGDKTPAKQPRNDAVKAKTKKKEKAQQPAGKKDAATPQQRDEKKPHDDNADATAREHEEQLAAERAAREAAQARCREAEREAGELRAAMDAALREREDAEQERLAAERTAREKAEQEAAALREAGRATKQRDAEEASAQAAAREREAAASKAEAAARKEAAAEKRRADEAERGRAEEARLRNVADAARQQAEEALTASAREAEQRELAQREAEAEARRRAEEAHALASAAERRAEELAAKVATLEAERRAATERAAGLEAALQEQAEQARRETEQQKARAEKRLAREKERMAKEEARQARASAAREARLEKERRDAQASAGKREAALAEKLARTEQRLKDALEAERRAREAAARAQADAREQLLLEEHARAMEEQAVDRAASALSGGVGMGPARASTRTGLEVPQRNGSGQSVRKRQPGEPNFYTLKPFRNTKAVRERAVQAGHAARRLASVGALALAALAALTGAFLNYTPAPAVGNVSAVAVTPAGGPVLLAGDRLFLHNRAGAPEAELALADLGVKHLYPPLAFEADGMLLALGSRGTRDARQLLRCDLTGDGCAPLPGLPDGIEVVAYAGNPVTGDLFLLDAAGGELLRTSGDGEVLARAALTLPERPALRLQSGLLLLNNGSGPTISVLRYDDSAFGTQLDEIVLEPPAAAAAGHSRVGDFLFSGGNWWVTLYNPDDDAAGLYRFDSRWNYLDEAALGHPSLPLALTNWADKTLVNDGRGIALGRFNASGGVEVPLASRPLEKLAGDSRLRVRLVDSAWRAGLVALAMVALLAFAGAYLQRLRQLVYRSAKERGAEPVDDLLDEVEWIGEAPGRRKALRGRLLSYGGIALALLLIATGQRVGALELAALLVLLLGPGIALALMARSSAGHLGVTGGRLLLVEPAGTYHLGGGAQLLYRGNLLFIDDVALYTGSKILPAFSGDEVSRRVEPLVEGGVRIDTRTALTRLLQSRHPLARGLAIIAACTVCALALLAAGAMF